MATIGSIQNITAISCLSLWLASVTGLRARLQRGRTWEALILQNDQTCALNRLQEEGATVDLEDLVYVGPYGTNQLSHDPTFPLHYSDPNSTMRRSAPWPCFGTLGFYSRQRQSGLKPMRVIKLYAELDAVFDHLT